VIHAKAATTSAKGAWAIRTYYSSVRKFYEKHHAADGPLRRAAWRTGVAVQERLALLRLRVRGRGLSY
jgi:hypothetical protein